MTISRQRLNQYYAALDDLSQRAQVDLRATFEMYMNLGYSLNDALDETIEVADMVSNTYGDMAATLAAEFFEQTSVDELGRRLDAELADPYSYDALRNNIEYAAHNHLFDTKKGVDTEGFTSFLGNVMDSAVKNAARSTMSLNTMIHRNTGVRYARVPRSAAPCAFCIMLASRGFVYYSAKTAAELDHYHRNCSCEAVASWDGDVEGYDQSVYEDMYFKGVEKAGGGGTKEILEGMRRTLDSSVCGDHVDPKESESSAE